MYPRVHIGAMTTRNPNAFGPLTREERAFWSEAFCAALPVVLVSNGNLVDRSFKRVAELAGEMAWSALDVYRGAAKGKRS